MRVKQTEVPPVEDQQPKKVPTEEAEKYLLANKWSHAGTNDRGETTWSDPAGAVAQRGVSKPSVELPSRDGNEPTVVNQTVCPPAAWSYTMTEAMTMQRMRDACKKPVAPGME